MSRKVDYLEECNDQRISIVEFKQIFCNRCRNTDCVNAGWSGSIWKGRMDTQVQALLEDPKFADLSNPKYAQIREADFPSLLHKAMRLEISDRKADWEPVPEIDISNGKDEIANTATTSTVDEAIKKMAAIQGKPAPDLPDPKEAMLESFQEDTDQMITDIDEESEQLEPEVEEPPLNPHPLIP